MNNISNIGAQGDVLFIARDEVPEGFSAQTPMEGRHVVAHSETGHHHVVSADTCDLFEGPSDPNVAYLRLADDAEWVDVEHLRGFDTHGTVRLTRRVYEVRRQQEYTPEGWRPAAD